MRISRTRNAIAARLLKVILFISLVCPGMVRASLEQTFDSLQVGSTTYRNVTVTTKSKNYVFILHSAGMTNIKVADLSPELRARLGYEDPNAAPVKTNSPAVWAKATLAKLDVAQVKTFRAQMVSLWGANASNLAWPPASMNRSTLVAAGGLLLVLYVLHCLCCLAICRKCGCDPGPIIWVPLLQLFPMLKAASMPAGWFLVFLIPGLNLLAHVVWFVKITRARGKGFGLALLLMFPLTSPFAMLYLAFSGGSPRKKDPSRRVEIMTLEAA